MADVKVPYGNDQADTATLLLAAAEELGLEPGVIRTQSHPDFHFLVPEEVVTKAAVDYEDDEGKSHKAKRTSSKTTGKGD